MRAHALLGGLLMCVVSGCGLSVPGGEAPPAPVADPADSAVADPGPLRGEPLPADLVVLADEPLPDGLAGRVHEVAGVRAAVVLSVASVAVADRTITVAGVDPATYRRFTPRVTAESDSVWRAVVRGEVVLGHRLGQDLRQPPGSWLPLGNREPGLRVGAHAATVPQIDAVVNLRRAEQLGMVAGNALLVSGAASPQAVRAAVGGGVAVQRLTATPPARGGRQAAYLTGSAVARAVGSFSYRYFPDGTVAPDVRWVAANIRTEPVPLLGRVTCHRAMLPQLRGALEEVERTGLAAAIDPSDYGGCYVPRFIGHDPSRGLSLHTWGIAIDLNVATNQRGSVGQIDRRVVAVFARWGFAWGGTWRWTDPMHFELAALVGVP